MSGALVPSDDGGSAGDRAEAHYSAVLVRTRPEALPACAVAVDGIPGVEVHLRHEASGRIIAVLESRDVRGQEALMAQVRAVPGVLAAALVYHLVDDGSAEIPS